MTWLNSVEHNRWLSRHMQALICAGRKAMVETGFAYTHADGSVDTSRPVELAMTGRFTHVFCLATLMGLPGSRKYADHGIRCMTKYFKDPVHGGWFSAIEHKPDDEGNGVPAGLLGSNKWQYANTFLALAAASATAANRPGGHDLLMDVIQDQESVWWDESVDRVRDGFSRDYSKEDKYRGMNSNMHTTEAYLAIAEVMNDPVWIDRATSILEFVYLQASKNDWRIGEHFDENWKPMPDHYRHTRDDKYYPYGVVIGHQMELSRLALHVRAANRTLGRTSPDWLMELAVELFERARVDGWRKNGQPGFAYTVDPEGEVVSPIRMQWVVTEGIAAAIALRRAILDDGGSEGEVEHYDHCYRAWIDYLEEFIIVDEGKWVGALTENNEVTDPEFSVLNDNYHGVQALLMPRLPLWPPFASALSRGLLDKPEEPPHDRKAFRLFRK